MRITLAAVFLHIAGAAAIVGAAGIVAWSIPNTDTVNGQFCALVAAFFPLAFGGLFIWGARLLFAGQSRGGAGLRILLGGMGSLAGVPVWDQFKDNGWGLDWRVAAPLLAFTAVCYGTIWLMSGRTVQAWYAAHAQPVVDPDKQAFIEAG